MESGMHEIECTYVEGRWKLVFLCTGCSRRCRRSELQPLKLWSLNLFGWHEGRLSSLGWFRPDC